MPRAGLSGTAGNAAELATLTSKHLADVDQLEHAALAPPRLLPSCPAQRYAKPFYLNRIARSAPRRAKSNDSVAVAVSPFSLPPPGSRASFSSQNPPASLHLIRRSLNRIKQLNVAFP